MSTKTKLCRVEGAAPPDGPSAGGPTRRRVRSEGESLGRRRPWAQRAGSGGVGAKELVGRGITFRQGWGAGVNGRKIKGERQSSLRRVADLINPAGGVRPPRPSPAHVYPGSAGGARREPQLPRPCGGGGQTHPCQAHRPPAGRPGRRPRFDRPSGSGVGSSDGCHRAGWVCDDALPTSPPVTVGGGGGAGVGRCVCMRSVRRGPRAGARSRPTRREPVRGRRGLRHRGAGRRTSRRW